MNKEILAAFFHGSRLSKNDLDAVVAYRAMLIESVSVNYELTGPEDRHSNIFTEIALDLPDTLEAQLQGSRIIELGPGNYPIVKELEPFGISSYVGVDPREVRTPHIQKLVSPRVSFEKTDALTYLLNHPSESAVVVSFGVLCPEVQTGPRSETIDYLKFVIHEIKRVTPPGGITINFYNFGLPADTRPTPFEEQGFAPLSSESPLSDMVYMRPKQ